MGDEAACSMPVAAARGGHDSPVGETPKEELSAHFLPLVSLSFFSPQIAVVVQISHVVSGSYFHSFVLGKLFKSRRLQK